MEKMTRVFGETTKLPLISLHGYVFVQYRFRERERERHREHVRRKITRLKSYIRTDVSCQRHFSAEGNEAAYMHTNPGIDVFKVRIWILYT